MDGRPPSEDARKIVHIGFGVCALLLRYITWWEAALVAGTAVAFNLLVMPRVGRRIYRPADQARRFTSGVVLYPVAVLLLVVVFSNRLDIAAAAWGILAVGDGMSCIIGKRFGRRRIPWNREKSVAGSMALFLLGGAAGAALAWWCRPHVMPPAYLWFSLGAPFIAALVAAFVETIPVRLDDNLSVPGSAGAVLWALSIVSEDQIRAFAAASAVWILPTAALNAAVAWLGYKAGTVTKAGAIAGAAIGVTIMLSAAVSGWLLLGATFLSAAISSRLGVRRKTLLGIAEERGGRRGAGNAVANTGFASAAALISSLSYAQDHALVAFAAALTAAGSDTIASEIGKAWGERTYLVTTFSAVKPGTSGAISLEGTAAGIGGAAILGGLAVVLGIVPAVALVPIVIGATIGSFAESVLAATLEGPGILNNDLLNFINTAVAAYAAILLYRAVT
ncbi:MAG TPA: DUF92 domain-containing protein [Vicinamibacterales bacterium]